MPTYNGGRYCSQQIESITNQSFTDFELLVVDDGSSDETVQRLAEAADQDRRVRLLPSDGTNRGQKTRLLELLAKAEGELIGFADQDDVWQPQKLERLIDELGEAGLAFGPSQIIDDAGRSTGQTLHSALEIALRPEDRLRSLAQPLVSAHAMIVRRDLVSEAAFCQSAPFDWLIGLDAQYTAGVRYVEDAVTLHRVHGGNQNNGHLLEGRGPLDWKARLMLPRSLMATGSRDRFSFWRRAIYLANSPIVGPEVRRAFAVICKACEDSWFVRQSPVDRGRDDPCQTILLEQLKPFAGSPEDWDDCQTMVQVLTSTWRTRHGSHMFL